MLKIIDGVLSSSLLPSTALIRVVCIWVENNKVTAIILFLIYLCVKPPLWSDIYIFKAMDIKYKTYTENIINAKHKIGKQIVNNKVMLVSSSI